MEDRNRKLMRTIVASYASPLVRLYSRIRFTILRQPFLEEIGQYLPRAGRILDIGCGFGLFSLYYAAMEPERRIVAVDRDARRIRFARASAEKLGLGNVTFRVGDAMECHSAEPFDAIYFLDLIHHLPRPLVRDFLTKIRRLVRDEGIVLIKDVASTPPFKVLFTLLLDRLMVGMEPIHYWPPEELAHLIEPLDFEVVRHRMTDFLPYPHILYVCRSRRASMPRAARADGRAAAPDGLTIEARADRCSSADADACGHKIP